jgi:1-deoxy-D-xylulose-5-phosphate synthase
MLKTAIDHDGPAALRYPRGNGYGISLDQAFKALPLGKSEMLREGSSGALLAVGSTVYPACEAADNLAADGLDFSVVNVRFIKPLDRDVIISLARATGTLVTVEENAVQGGFGTAVLELLEEEGIEGVKVLRLGYPDLYVEQGEQPELRAKFGLDAPGITERVRTFMRS